MNDFIKRFLSLKNGFKFSSAHKQSGRINYTTYSQNGKKYLIVFCMGKNGALWSKHFIVDKIAEDRGINTDFINNETLFKELQQI